MKTYYLSSVINDRTYEEAIEWAKKNRPSYVYHTERGLFSVVRLHDAPIQHGQHEFRLHLQEGRGELFE